MTAVMNAQNKKPKICFRFDALTELGAFMRTEVLYISVLRVKLANFKVL